MRLLVVGGAGYIGSHMTKMLVKEGHRVTVLDNLSAGYADAIVEGATFVQGDIGDRATLDAVFSAGDFNAVFHFASCIQVAESVLAPAKYYLNNVSNTLRLLDAMVEHGVSSFIFSSTAAIFGEPQYVPLDEDHPKQPVNPYGRTKWMIEQALADYDRAYGLKSTCLRYFNAAGADPEGELGERHDPETHLIPLVLQAASGRRESITIFGSDYPTHDGTCIRDYIHVWDLAAAHLLALDRMERSGESGAYNLGNGAGFTIREVISAAESVTGRSIPVVQAGRREGDPAVLVADASKAREELGWRPRLAGLETIVEHAWRWELNRAAGKRAMGNR